MAALSGTPGHISTLSRVIVCMTSGLIAEGGLSTAVPLGRTATFSSAMTRASVRPTSSTDSSGMTRQFTLARAVCGSAFSACPASSMVATQVVRIWAL
jgi:hypothetical protein